MTLTARKSVLIVDDSAFIRHALCELFRQEADFEVCGEAENGKEGIDKAQALRRIQSLLYAWRPLDEYLTEVCSC